MKKIHNWLEANDAAIKARKAASKAHWRSIGKTRQCAYYGVIALSLVIAVTGVLTQAIYTALLASVMTLYAQPLILREGNWRRRFAIVTATSPLVAFPLAIAIGGLTMNIDYEEALRDQTIVSKHTESVSRDARQFLADYRAGKFEGIGHLTPDHFTADLDANDPIGYEGAKYFFRLMHLSAPAEVDASPTMPLAEVFFADHVIMLLNRDLAKRRLAEQNAALEAHFGMPAKEIPAADRLAAQPEYFGIYGLTCYFDNEGRILMATGLPSAYQTDLNKVPAAEPFVEVCRSLANDQSTIAQAAQAPAKVSWR